MDEGTNWEETGGEDRELGHDEGRKWEETGGEDVRPSGGRGDELGRNGE